MKLQKSDFIISAHICEKQTLLCCSSGDEIPTKTHKISRENSKTVTKVFAKETLTLQSDPYLYLIYYSCYKVW